MKEQIEKLANAIAKAATFLKEEKTADAVAALEEAGAATTALAEEATTAEATATAQTAELEAAKLETVEKDAKIAKWASLNVSTDDLPSLFEELGAVKTMLSGMTSAIEKASSKEDIEALGTRLEAIEKTSISRQSQEEQRTQIEKSMIGGLDLAPRA